MHYDPMIAKLVVWGESRNAALVKLKNCLSNFQVYMPNTFVYTFCRSLISWIFLIGLVTWKFTTHYHLRRTGMLRIMMRYF